MWYQYRSFYKHHFEKSHRYSKKADPNKLLGELTAREPDGHNNDGDNNSNNDTGIHDGIFSRLNEASSYLDGVGTTANGIPPTTPWTVLTTPPFSAVDIDSLTEGWAVPGSFSEGGTLPAARAVSNNIMDQDPSISIPNAAGLNEWFQFFGQALTHDIAEAATGQAAEPNLGAAPFGPASGNLNNFVGFFAPPFTGLPRTPAEADPETGLLNQINEETSFLDLSMIYGNKDTMLNIVRDGADGYDSAKLLIGESGHLPTIYEATQNRYGVETPTTEQLLQTLRDFTAPGFGGLPDPDNPATATAIDVNDPNSWVNLFLAGDNRVNQTPQLIAQHAIWWQEHNYWVEKFSPTAMKYGWSQDQLFEVARAITEGEWQNIVYNEYLPKLIGEHALSAYEGYKEWVDPSIINEFTTVAFRFGHDQSSQTQTALDENGNNVAFDVAGVVQDIFTLVDAFVLTANGARDQEALDSWIRGQLSATTQEIDGHVVDGNRNFLFGAGRVDLESIDIGRARDHGVWSYNDLREAMGLNRYESIEQFASDNNLTEDRLEALKNVYGDVDIFDPQIAMDKVDAVIGVLLEKNYYDSQLGETGTLLIAMQFENVRDGDQFYFENRFADNPKLLAEIKSTTMADILERNTDIDHLYHDAFLSHQRIAGEGDINGTDSRDLIVGSDWNDKIWGGYGDDDIYGGKGGDVIWAGGGNDLIWGGGGKNIFVFEEYSGYDTIYEFSKKYDKLDLTALGIDSWRDVKKISEKTSDGLVLHVDDHSTITLVGVKSLSKKNFIFDDDHDYGLV